MLNNLKLIWQRSLVIAGLLTVMLASRVGAEPLRIQAAGSLAGALREAITQSGLPATEVASPIFGPAGLLRQRIESGEPTDVFASADLQQPQRLAAMRTEVRVVPFARNRMCLATRRIPDTAILDLMLEPATRLGVSTAGVDPGGDYARAVFARADRLRPDTASQLEAKALDVLGPGRMAPVAGRSAAASVFLANEADALLYYCSALHVAAKEVPGLFVQPLPAELEVGPIYALALLTVDPRADRLAVFLLSEAGQALLVQHGLLRLTDPVDTAGPR